MNRERLRNIRIVLVGTAHPGNIGAAARALQTMGLADLALVAPLRFPAPEAVSLASGAGAVLSAARVHATLAEAVADCGFVVGASARSRTIPWPELAPRACAARLVEAAAGAPAALVFGRENAGLSNEELELCQALVRIPTVPEAASLNVAAAVQVLACEIFGAAGGESPPPPVEAGVRPATNAELEQLYAHLEQTLVDVEFHDRAKPRRLMRRLRRLIGRAGLDRQELQILRGMLTAVQEKLLGR